MPAGTLIETLEREVKLQAPPWFRLPSLPGEHLPRRIFTSTYFDTKDHSLGSLGITLRRRVEQGKGTWQLKLPSGSARLELAIHGGPGKIPDEFLDLLFALLRKSEVVPIAKLRTERIGVQVRQTDRDLTEITQDSVALLDGRRIRNRLFEIEVELIEGDEANLNQITQTLQAAGAREGDRRAKVFQALDLAYPQDLPQVDPSAPPKDHLNMMLQQQVNEMLLHDPGTRLGKDPEHLHQMRVATRRFRALLRAARPLLIPEWTQNFRLEVGWLGGILGTVRDYDVLLQDLRGEADSLGPLDHRAFERLLLLLENQRSIARATMLAALRSDRYLELLNRLEHTTTQIEIVKTDITLNQLAAKEFHKLRKSVTRLSTNSSDDKLHRIRIRTKRARYAAELAERSTGKPASRFIRQAKKFQDLLGTHQDAVMTEQRLRDLLRATRGVKAAFAVGQIVERLRIRRQQVRKTLSRQWIKVRKQGKKAWAENPRQRDVS